MKDEERVALAEASAEDYKRILDGEEVTLEAGLTFKLHPKSTSVAGRKIGVIVARPARKVGVNELETARNETNEIQKQLFAAISSQAIPEPVQTLIRRLIESRNNYENIMAEYCAEALKRKDRIREEHMLVPSMLSKESGRVKADISRQKDPVKAASEAAKSAAENLWPEANRKGWTAAQFRTALNDAGHAVPHETARKWLTKLRQTGTC
jgi:hypothetical protein